MYFSNLLQDTYYVLNGSLSLRKYILKLSTGQKILSYMILMTLHDSILQMYQNVFKHFCITEHIACFQLFYVVRTAVYIYQ